MLLRLLLLWTLECLPGRSLTVRVGDGERERGLEDGAVTMTMDMSSSDMSVSDRWSP